MDPLTIAALVYGGSSLLGTGASVYGANMQDKQNAAALAYSKERDALADKRQAEQDKIAERLRRKQEIEAMLAKAEQQRQLNASRWLPPMSRQGA